MEQGKRWGENSHLSASFMHTFAWIYVFLALLDDFPPLSNPVPLASSGQPQHFCLGAAGGTAWLWLLKSLWVQQGQNCVQTVLHTQAVKCKVPLQRGSKARMLVKIHEAPLLADLQMSRRSNDPRPVCHCHSSGWVSFNASPERPPAKAQWKKQEDNHLFMQEIFSLSKTD